MLTAFVLSAVLDSAASVETPPPLSPLQILGRIRAQFRSHRPPPAYETYTLQRTQRNADGSLDRENSYVFHVWVRNGDRAALKRRVPESGPESAPAFDRPTFNGEGDPGPPTADVFEPRPVKQHPVSQPYTPEPQITPMAEIGRVRSLSESDYRVTNVSSESGLLHLKLEPISDPERNRLRELYADGITYELTAVVANDKLYVDGGARGPFDESFTMTMGSVAGVPIVTRVHGEVLAATAQVPASARAIDYAFEDIAFPAALPEWYFDARSYGAHLTDLPL